MLDPALRPTDIAIARGGSLRICWSDGRLSDIPLPVLRKACPCAQCRESQGAKAGSGLPVIPAPAAQAAMTAVAGAELVGYYAVRMRWQDGHDVGIYDYELLRRLGRSGERQEDGGANDTHARDVEC
ncbi:MAG TPA: DUF971 domain-containing protein [Phycisphaerae bacterium]|nr:DUF971 domain-containing protein [Phycisphaerae bacterium]